MFCLKDAMMKKTSFICQRTIAKLINVVDVTKDGTTNTSNNNICLNILSPFPVNKTRFILRYD